MTPVTILTGFLGSGKTTLLSRLLRDPAFGRVAVIVNEFGEVGIDHDLVAASDEQLIELATGCLCCKVRSDLAATLQDLAARRAAGTVPAFQRVVIETSGLADPASVLQALMTDVAVAEAYCLHNVVTTVDAVLGEQTLSRHAQSIRQAAVADVLVLTKTDLSDGAGVRPLLAGLNPGARVASSSAGQVGAAVLLEETQDPVERFVRLGRGTLPAHGLGMASTCCVLEQPVSAVALALFLQAVVEHCGAGLLRMKGIVHVKETPGTPAVVHGVQHVFHAPQWLPRWPSDDRRTRLVFIGARPPSAAWVEGLLDLLEREVEEETSRRSS